MKLEGHIAELPICVNPRLKTIFGGNAAPILAPSTKVLTSYTAYGSTGHQTKPAGSKYKRSSTFGIAKLGNKSNAWRTKKLSNGILAVHSTVCSWPSLKSSTLI